MLLQLAILPRLHREPLPWVDFVTYQWPYRAERVKTLCARLREAESRASD